MKSITAAAIAAAVCFGATGLEAKTYKMKIGMVTINDSNHLLAKWFKKELGAKSNGRIKVEVYPAAQLGKFRVKSRACSSERKKHSIFPQDFS